MSEREFYISIVPDVAKAIVLLRNVSKNEREQIKQEMLNNCKRRPDALRFMEKLWVIIESYLNDTVVA